MNNRRLLIFGAFLLLFPFSGFAQSIQLADSLFQKGRDFDRRGNTKQSEFYYREAFHIYKSYKDTVSWLEAGKEYASALLWRSKHEQATELYKKLLEIDHPANDAYNRGDLYNSLGLSHRRIGQIDKAAEYYQKALELAKMSGDELLIGVVYSNLGVVHQARGKNSKALELFKQSIPYFREIDRRHNIAISLNNIATIYSDLSLYDRALEYLDRSLNIRRDTGNLRLLAGIYNELGSIQSNLGNYDQSLIAYNQSLEYSRNAGTPQRTSNILNNLGLLYKKLGEYDKALDYYRQSLAIREKVSGPSGIATTTHNLGQLLWELGRKEEAGTYYRKALHLRQQVGNPYDIASSLNTMLRLTVDQENYNQAAEYINQLKAIGDSTGSYDMLKTTFTFKGRILEGEGRNNEALENFKKAYSYARFLPPGRQLTPLKDLANQYHKMGSDSAVVYGQKVVNIIEEHRASAGALSSFKSGYFGKHSDFYTLLASWVLTYTSDIHRAYRLVEQAKARSLSEELAKASQNIGEQLPEKVRIERSQMRNHINRLYSQLDDAVEAADREQISRIIRDAELEYAAFENKIHRQYAPFNNFLSPEPVTLEKAQQLTDEETAVLEYAVAENQLIMFLISQNNVRVEQFSLSDGDRQLAEQLTTWVTNFKDAILSNASRTRLRAASQPLYEILLNPFEDALENFSNLIIVPDGALAYLPFEAISQGDQYLIENYRIKYEPSLTSLTLLQEPKPIDRKDLLAVAGSQLSETDGQSVRASRLAALPSTLIEVDSIATNFQQVTILKNDQVTEQKLKNLLRNNRYQYIHLATHGVIDEENPGRSGLALTGGGVNASSKEDGMLRSSEIFGMNLNADMVVLSACNTGLGKVVDGEGMLGMQRSFFYAGASTVVVSLWNVYDRSTASFMNEFYKALLNSNSEEGWLDSLLRWVGWEESIPFGQKAAAMRQAKLQMIKHPLFNHPIYWAPFIVVGR